MHNSDLVGLMFPVTAVWTCESGFNVESYLQAWAKSVENPANHTFESEGVREATSALLQQVFAGVLQPRLQIEELTDSTSEPRRSLSKRSGLAWVSEMCALVCLEVIQHWRRSVHAAVA